MHGVSRQVLPQLKRISIGDADAGVIERLECLVAQKCVLGARGLVDRVHSKLWKAHVNGVHTGLNVREIAQSRSAGHVASVSKDLVRDVLLLPDSLDDGTAERICAVRLTCCFLDNHAAVEIRLVSHIVLLGIIGMDRMSVVAAYQQGCRECAVVIFLRKTKRSVYALQSVFKERRLCALLSI